MPEGGDNEPQNQQEPQQQILPSTTTTPTRGSLDALPPLHSPPLRSPLLSNSNELSQLPELRARIRRHVHGTIQSCIPWEQRRAYTMAFERNAHVVLTETDPLQFVRMGRYNLLAGAQRLCRCWTERLALFGPQRAFLPLSLTGAGALTREDIEQTLSAGFPALIVPNENETDSRVPTTGPAFRGCLVDRRQRLPTATTENLLRAWFYLAKLLAQDDMLHGVLGDDSSSSSSLCFSEPQVEGIDCLWVVVTPRNYKVDWELVRRIAWLAAHVFPLQWNFYLLGIPLQKRPDHAVSILAEAATTLRDCFRGSQQDCRITQHLLEPQPAEPTSTKQQPQQPQHQAASPQQPNSVVQSLLSTCRGLKRQGIPQSFGGQWTCDHFIEWCRYRKRLELLWYKDQLLKLEPTKTTASSSNVAASPTSPPRRTSSAQKQQQPSGITGNVSAGTTASTRSPTTASKGMPPRTSTAPFLPPPSHQTKGGITGSTTTTAFPSKDSSTSTTSSSTPNMVVLMPRPPAPPHRPSAPQQQQQPSEQLTGPTRQGHEPLALQGRQGGAAPGGRLGLFVPSTIVPQQHLGVTGPSHRGDWHLPPHGDGGRPNPAASSVAAATGLSLSPAAALQMLLTDSSSISRMVLEESKAPSSLQPASTTEPHVSEQQEDNINSRLTHSSASSAARRKPGRQEPAWMLAQTTQPQPHADRQSLPESVALQRKRTSNLIASRKLRQRYHTQRQSLEEQVSTLRLELKRLQNEFARLHHLWDQAQAHVAVPPPQSSPQVIIPRATTPGSARTTTSLAPRPSAAAKEEEKEKGQPEQEEHQPLALGVLLHDTAAPTTTSQTREGSSTSNIGKNPPYYESEDGDNHNNTKEKDNN